MKILENYLRQPEPDYGEVADPALFTSKGGTAVVNSWIQEVIGNCLLNADAWDITYHILQIETIWPACGVV